MRLIRGMWCGRMGRFGKGPQLHLVLVCLLTGGGIAKFNSLSSDKIMLLKSSVYGTEPCSVCTVCVQVLHLVGVALLEEQQQLENRSGDDDITFNYTSKITRQYLGKTAQEITC